VLFVVFDGYVCSAVVGLLPLVIRVVDVNFYISLNIACISDLKLTHSTTKEINHHKEFVEIKSRLLNGMRALECL
jgi:hypothetical protein